MNHLDQEKYTKIAALVAEESTDIIYLINPSNYQLLYMNKRCRNLLGDPPEHTWRGKPCYQVLENMSGPCPFCNNHELETERFTSWSHYNSALGRHFTMRDKLVNLDGQMVRLEIASDVTEIQQANTALRHQLHTGKTLLECVGCLSSAPSLSGAVDRLLALVGAYYAGDRAYIFSIDQDRQVLVNTNEWCRDGVAPQIESLDAIPLSTSTCWMQLRLQDGQVYIPDMEAAARDNDEYRILYQRGISSLIAVSLQDKEQFVGFVGVDNPRDNTPDLTLLRSLSSFIAQEQSKRKLTQRLHYLSYTDPLTGAGNHRRYTELLRTLEDSPPASLGALYLDINGLRQINGLYGHEYGDFLLRHTAKTLMALSKGEVCRVGGDEFIMLCPNISRHDFDVMVNDLYLKAAQDPHFTPSLGPSWAEGPNININQQIARSDHALSVDKQDYYLRRLEGGRDYHAQMTQQLREELDSGRFDIHLQPQLDLKTGELRGAEALVRRWDEDGRPIPPPRFIPLYEAEGLVLHVDLFVLQRVCATLRSWTRRGGTDLPPIAVNFSRVTMMEHDIVARLLDICQRYQIPPHRIKLEVTESIGSLDPSTLDTLIHTLSDYGFSISLDDFGAEYSNLALLSSTHFDELKLDKSLIDSLEGNANAQIVTTHTVQVCRELGDIVSVAEGIERKEQWDILTRLGCALGQGFLFDRPMPPEEFEKKYIFP